MRSERMKCMTEQGMNDLLKLGFRHVGDFSLREQEVQFSLTECKHEKGVYAFLDNQKIVYVGVTKNTLYARMNGYKNPGPSQKTNKRIKPRIVQTGKVQIYFLPEDEIVEFTMEIRRNGAEKQIRADLGTFECFLISMFKPKWNIR
jgi:hypothetical protein